MEQYISKDALVAEIKRLKDRAYELYGCSQFDTAYNNVLKSISSLEVKEVDITKMADEYYDALMKETDWMDEGTMGHCRLAYYTGCKDVLNKIQKGE